MELGKQREKTSWHGRPLLPHEGLGDSRQIEDPSLLTCPVTQVGHSHSEQLLSTCCVPALWPSILIAGQVQPKERMIGGVVAGPGFSVGRGTDPEARQPLLSRGAAREVGRARLCLPVWPLLVSSGRFPGNGANCVQATVLPTLWTTSLRRNTSSTEYPVNARTYQQKQKFSFLACFIFQKIL